MKSEIMRISNELQAQKDKIKENTEKIKVNKTLPYLVSNVVEVGLSFHSKFVGALSDFFSTDGYGLNL